MSKSVFFPGTKVRIGQWYPASIAPPDIHDTTHTAPYTMLLYIPYQGVVPGFFVQDEGVFYFHCERYDSMDDEPIEGYTREQEINNCLEWSFEIAPELTGWMIIPNLNEDKFPIFYQNNSRLIGQEDEDNEQNEDDPIKPKITPLDKLEYGSKARIIPPFHLN